MPGLFEPNQPIAGANHPGISDPISKPDARTEVATFQFARRMREIENLRVQVKYGGVVVDFGRREIQRIARSYVQCETVRDLPVVTGEKLCDVCTLLKRLILDVKLRHSLGRAKETRARFRLRR